MASSPLPLATPCLRLLPLDARPVCLDFPRRLAAMAGIRLLTPPVSILGAVKEAVKEALKQPADTQAVQAWLAQDADTPLVLALDTLAYGGLIPSRVGSESLAGLQQRLAHGFAAIHTAPVWAFSSILRIPQYDSAEEEPDYWAQWGRALYAYSEAVHREGRVPDHAIPEPVLADFLARRARNLALNRGYLDDLAAGRLRWLSFCQDDTGAYGLNVQEAQALQQEADARGLNARLAVQTGADELAATLMTRWYHARRATPLRVHPCYSHPQGSHVQARFDGVPIADVVARQIAACGALPTADPAQADVILMIHTPAAHMGDYCEDAPPDCVSSQYQTVLSACQQAFSSGKRLILADVACANGSDNTLTAHLLAAFPDLTGLYGYAGWNTPGNTLGSALAMGLLRTLAEEAGCFDADAFARLLLIRLADDGLYQSRVRQALRRLAVPDQPPCPTALATHMAEGLVPIQRALSLSGMTVGLGFPCQRLFEVEITPDVA